MNITKAKNILAGQRPAKDDGRGGFGHEKAGCSPDFGIIFYLECAALCSAGY